MGTQHPVFRYSPERVNSLISLSERGAWVAEDGKRVNVSAQERQQEMLLNVVGWLR